MSKRAIGIMLFTKHLKYLLDMNDEAAGRIIKAVVDKHINDTDKGKDFDLSEKIVYEMLIDDVESSLDKYVETCQRRSAIGKMGANARWKKEKNVSENQSPAPWEKEEPKDIFPVSKEENEEIIPFENVLEKNIPDENVSENIQPAEKASEENIPEKTVPKFNMSGESVREFMKPDENISEEDLSIPKFETIEDMMKMEKELFQ